MHPDEDQIREDMLSILPDYDEVIEGIITVIDRYRDTQRGNYAVGRRLSLAITDLENAQDKIRRVITSLQGSEDESHAG